MIEELSGGEVVTTNNRMELMAAVVGLRAVREPSEVTLYSDGQYLIKTLTQGWIEPGQQHLDGYHALWYGRARYGVAGGDYERMRRQAVLQEAILQQFTPTNVLSKFQEVASAGADTVKTDIPGTS